MWITFVFCNSCKTNVCFANKAGYRINLPFIAENYNVYSDKLMLGVIDLNHIELATDEDKQYNIDYWAKLFKAKTWEEIKMLSAENNYMAEAANTIFKLSSEEQIRKRCSRHSNADTNQCQHQGRTADICGYM